MTEQCSCVWTNHFAWWIYSFVITMLLVGITAFMFLALDQRSDLQDAICKDKFGPSAKSEGLRMGVLRCSNPSSEAYYGGIRVRLVNK